jgi:hypothetical protein
MIGALGTLGVAVATAMLACALVVAGGFSITRLIGRRK